jgi:hypothetical protein
MLPDDIKKELDWRGITIGYIDKRAKTALAQIKKLKGALPDKADSDLNHTLPREDNLASFSYNTYSN